MLSVGGILSKFPQFCAKSENVSAANKTGCVAKHFEIFARADNAFFRWWRGIATIALDRRRTAPTKDTGNEVNAAAVFSVRNNDVRTSRSKLLAATAIKAARTYTLGHTYSENHAIPESRLAQGAGEVTTRTTTEMATR